MCHIVSADSARPDLFKLKAGSEVQNLLLVNDVTVALLYRS